MTPTPDPTCAWCHEAIPQPPGKRGPKPTYCSDTHRLRAADARRLAAKQLDRHNERARAVAIEAAELMDDA